MWKEINMNDFFNYSNRIIGKDFNVEKKSDNNIKNLDDLADNLESQGISCQVNSNGNVYDLTRELGYGREVVAKVDSSWFSQDKLKGLLGDLFDFEQPDMAALVAKLNLDSPDAPSVYLINPITGKNNLLPVESFMESIGSTRCDFLHTEDPTPEAMSQFQINGWSDNHIPTIGNVDFRTLDVVNQYYADLNKATEDLSGPLNFHTDGHGSFDIDVWMAERGFEPGSREGLEALTRFAEPPERLPEKPLEVYQLEMMSNMPSKQQIELQCAHPELFNDDSPVGISPHAMNGIADREASMLEKADYAEAHGHFSTALSLRRAARELGHLMDSGHWD